VSVFGVVGGHGASGKNKCAAIVCRLLCVGFAALLFLRSVGCIIMVIVLVSVEVMNCRHSMTPYGQGFLLCWYSVIVQPEPKLSKVNAVDGIFCCSALFVQPELQLISDMSMSLYSSASIAENRMLPAVLLFFFWFIKIL